jgi:transposase
VLVELGWDVRVSDAAKVKGLAPLACKTDRIDAWVLAELSRRQLVPAIWLPGMPVRQAREHARWRLHLVKHRTMLKQRVHSMLVTFGVGCPVSDLFGSRGRQLLADLEVPQPWRGHVAAAVAVIDHLDAQIDACEKQMAELVVSDPRQDRLQTIPGIGPILAFTIAAEIGDIARFPSASKFVGYTGLCPRVYQSGSTDRRGPLAKNGPKYLRWALIEAATHACHHRLYKGKYQRTRARLGRQRGPKIARTELARELAKTIWVMLTKQEDFAPADATRDLAA